MTGQFLRTWVLVVQGLLDIGHEQQQNQVVDLSNLRFRFQTYQNDEQSPNAASIRVYNLADATVQKVTNPNLQAPTVTIGVGYGDETGVIFKGTIKQYKIGRESPTDSFLDILAPDADVGYNFGIVNTVLPPVRSHPVL